eukprot:166260-Pleurochrysis_carterae.AAC.4
MSDDELAWDCILKRKIISDQSTAAAVLELFSVAVPPTQLCPKISSLYEASWRPAYAEGHGFCSSFRVECRKQHEHTPHTLDAQLPCTVCRRIVRSVRYKRTVQIAPKHGNVGPVCGRSPPLLRLLVECGRAV